MSSVANDARFWDRIARKYAADRIADMVGYERTLERTRHYLKSDHAVFEFGCGTGTTALKLAPYVGRIVATDISREMIVIAREKAEAEGGRNAEFEVATPDAVSSPDGTFDVALGFNILHLVGAPEAALRGVRPADRPDVGLPAEPPAFWHIWRALRDSNPCYRRERAVSWTARRRAREARRHIESFAGAGKQCQGQTGSERAVRRAPTNARCSASISRARSAAAAAPFCNSSIECLSGERTNAMVPSRGGRLMVTPAFISRSQTA